MASARSMLAILRTRTRSGSVASRGGCKSSSAPNPFAFRRCRGRGPHARAAPPNPAPLSQSASAAPSSFYTARFYTACAMPPVPSGSLSCSVRLMGYACALAAATAASTVSLAKSNVSPGPPAAALIELIDVLDTE